MGIIEDFKIYRDKFGLTGLSTNGTQGDTSQNGALFTMEYIIHLINDPNVSNIDKWAELNRLRDVYDSLEVLPGVSVRYPGDKEFESMDNAGAIFTFSGLHDDGRFSERAYKHGKSTRADGIDEIQDADKNKKFYPLAKIMSGFRAPRFFWNNNNPTKFCFQGWHGRSPAYRAFMKLTAGRFVGPWGQFMIFIGQFLGLTTNTGDSDARKLAYVNWQFLKKHNFVWALLYRIWCSILMSQYANGMKDVYGMYYRDPNHPIHKHSVAFLP